MNDFQCLFRAQIISTLSVRLNYIDFQEHFVPLIFFSSNALQYSMHRMSVEMARAMYTKEELKCAKIQCVKHMELI